MASWKAWKTKASAWLKRALIITVITIATLIALFLIIKLFVGVTKTQLRKEIATLEAQLQYSGRSPPVY